MAELNIGKHCSSIACKQLDFLPLTCNGCQQVFCQNHFPKIAHGCAQEERTGSTYTSEPFKNYSCSLDDCAKTELVPVPCDRCRLNFCMQHRHPSDHACKVEEALRDKPMARTAEHVKQILESKQPASQGKRKSQKAMETQAKVALMKLKMSAAGNKGLPQESRIYLNIMLPSQEPMDKPLGFFLDQKWSVGKGVDTIADRVKIKNENNKAGAPKLRLRTLNAGLLYPMDQSFRALLDTKELYNGSTLELCYVDELLTR